MKYLPSKTVIQTKPCEI